MRPLDTTTYKRRKGEMERNEVEEDGRVGEGGMMDKSEIEG